MKKILVVAGILFSTVSMSQSYKIGKIDADGKIILNVDKSKGSDLLNKVCAKKNMEAIHVNEISFTKMNRGQICLTGYEKDAAGKIISGIRVQCTQDDENNLILISTNLTERVSGKAFPATAVAAE